MNKKYLTLFFCAFIASLSLFAQNQSDSLIMRDILLEKDYSPQIENAGKVYQTPGTEALNTNKQPVKFATEGNRIDIDKDYVPMQAAEAKVDFPAQDMFGYVRLGLGNLSANGHAQLNILRQDRQRLETSLQGHYFPRFTKYADETFYNNLGKLQVDYQYDFNAFALTASLKENYQTWNRHLAATSNEDIARSSDSRLQVGIASKPWGNDFNYSILAEAGLFYLDQLKGGLAGRMERELNMAAAFSYQIDDNWTALLDVDFKNTGYSKISLNDLYWFDIQPKATYRWKLWNFALGMHLSDIVGKESSFKVAAIASAERTLGEKAAFSLNIDGGERVYSYRDGFALNPYMTFDERIQASYSPIDAKANILWNPLNELQLRAEGGYQYLQKLAQFDASNLNAALSYLNTNVFYAGAGMDVRYGKMLRLSADVQYRHYDKDVNYLPALQCNAALDFRPIENLSITGTYHCDALRTAASDYHYFAAGINYRLTKRWDIFAQASKRLDPQFGFWQEEGAKALVFHVGASYSF